MHLPAQKTEKQDGVSGWRETNCASIAQDEESMYSGDMFRRPGIWDEEGG